MKQDIKPPADPQTVPAGHTACQADGKTSTPSNTIVKIRESEEGKVSYRLEKSSPAQSTVEPALTKSARSQKTLIVSSIATVVVGAYFGYQAYQNHQKSTSTTANGATPPVVTVTSCQSRTQPVKDALSVTGSVWAWDPLSVGAEVNGLRITSVTVEEGDHVHKGQVLATLNSTLLRAQLQQAKARLLSSQANHNKAIQPNRPEDILALKAALAQAEANVAQEEARRKQADANLGNAEVMAGRFTQLAKAGAISTQDAENKQVSAITAREEVKSADEKVNASRFTVDQARQR
ncbi:MAG: biotin/lipoyl-binding protein, partial [Candidatus Obscuribacterales bacterium]|nr:biotin/lipoyl-binding protein [Candidatus Obscuribacterales bacterium]